NSRVSTYEGQCGPGHDYCRLLRDRCSIRLDPVGRGAGVSAKQALLSSAGATKGRREPSERFSMTTLLFVLSLLGGSAAAWLCERYFEPWRRAAWVEGGPRSHRAKLNAAWPIVGALVAGTVATAFILLALG